MKTSPATQAFTLVEIMIVVAIIGLLAAVAMPSFKKAGDDASKTTCQMNLKAIAGAKMSWALENKQLMSVAPADAAIFGKDMHIQRKPVCPRGGSYILNPINTEPACSIPGHTL